MKSDGRQPPRLARVMPPSAATWRRGLQSALSRPRRSVAVALAVALARLYLVGAHGEAAQDVLGVGAAVVLTLTHQPLLAQRLQGVVGRGARGVGAGNGSGAQGAGGHACRRPVAAGGSACTLAGGRARPAATHHALAAGGGGGQDVVDGGAHLARVPANQVAGDCRRAGSRGAGVTGRRGQCCASGQAPVSAAPCKGRAGHLPCVRPWRWRGGV